MKLSEVIEKLDKSPRNEDYVDTTRLGYELGLQDVPYVEQKRIKSYWLGNWFCTDTYVGYKIYFLDDKPVAYSEQKGRKWYEEFEWFSMEVAKETKNYLLTFVVEEDLNVVTVDIDSEIPDGYRVEYSDQIIDTTRLTLRGKPVKIIERIQDSPYGIDTKLKVRLLDGLDVIVDVRELTFGFHTTKE